MFFGSKLHELALGFDIGEGGITQRDALELQADFSRGFGVVPIQKRHGILRTQGGEVSPIVRAKKLSRGRFIACGGLVFHEAEVNAVIEQIALQWEGAFCVLRENAVGNL